MKWSHGFIIGTCRGRECVTYSCHVVATEGRLLLGNTEETCNTYVVQWHRGALWWVDSSDVHRECNHYNYQLRQQFLQLQLGLSGNYIQFLKQS